MKINNDYGNNAIESEFEKRKKEYVERELKRVKREFEILMDEYSANDNVKDPIVEKINKKAFSFYCDILKGTTNPLWIHRIIGRINDYASGLPLTPIIDDPQDWVDLKIIKKGVIKKEYCKRYPRLFRETYKDGHIMYRDNDRVSAFDHILGLNYHFGLCNLVYDEMFPIKLPYEVESENARFYIHTFLSNRDDKDSEFDTAALLFIEKPNGEQIPINRYFRVANEDEEPDIGGWVKIGVKELEERIKTSKSNLELSDLAYKLGDDIVVYPDGKTEEDTK